MEGDSEEFLDSFLAEVSHDSSYLGSAVFSVRGSSLDVSEASGSLQDSEDKLLEVRRLVADVSALHNAPVSSNPVHKIWLSYQKSELQINVIGDKIVVVHLSTEAMLE